jgi:hypothetical protein
MKLLLIFILIFYYFISIYFINLDRYFNLKLKKAQELNKMVMKTDKKTDKTLIQTKIGTDG